MAAAASSASESAYRFERKFHVDECTTREIEAVVRLHPAMFSPIHSRRYVNNVYFDSVDRRALADSLEGTADRVKMRVRWYGELFGEHAATLEFKIKHGQVGRKESVALGPLRIAPGLTRADLRHALARIEAPLPAALREQLATGEPTLVNRYRRRYYRSADGRYRLTLDDELQYFGFDGGVATFAHGSRDRRGSVVELKYAPEHDRDAHRITSRLPFRLTRSSKYVAGLQRLSARG